MGLMDEIRRLTHPYSDNDSTAYDEYDEEEEYEEEAAPAPRRNFTTRGAAAAESNAERTPTMGRVMNINPSSSMQVVLVKPERFDQVSDIANRLRDKQSVVLNLEATNKDVARRVVDFLSGTAYALDGKIRKIAVSTYLVIPYNVEMIGETLEDTEPNNYI
jgi:cell division inhibitor SepF